MIDEALMSFEEKSAYKLRSIYLKYGYLPYKMGKFEEYELYIRNKDFLVSDRVITFNDTNGKLMALKPDVTLSIIKNGEDVKGQKQKVFYNENVYRVSSSTHRFKEIMQTGLECIGDIDIYDIFETISLSAESLSTFSDNFCIEVSNLDLVGAVIASVSDDKNFKRKVINCILEKNAHDLKKICDSFDVDEKGFKKIEGLITVYGERSEVIAKLKEMYDFKEVKELELLSNLLDTSKYKDNIKFDFSTLNDMNYYNGFVYKGFIDGGSAGVLSGGQYDNMMKKMKRNSAAVGFAIYLDVLEDIFRESEKYDVDYLLLYDDKTEPIRISKIVREYVLNGFSISAQKSIPEKLRYKEIIDIKKGD